MDDLDQTIPSSEGEGEDETLEAASRGEGPTVQGYRVLRKVGEGGMGEVYEAEQLDPVRRVVALKVIKWGMDTKEVLARFESERQALALMSHPSIAGVYEAGATPAGRPYFSMELVRGVPITEYCDQHQLKTSERLRLFIRVCEGVQHAHQKGIIHRDLKPSNVLVTIQQGEPVPKVIDFGLAKATAQRLTERTVFTEYGQLIGTPEYMSPEQAEMSGLDVDTRTDIYSLGVMLYELLVGTVPFASRELRAAGFDGIRKRIREEDPPRPSTRLSRADPDSVARARNRRSDPSTLARRLRGDLDWITMKALEKDRTRRYETAQGLALDIERHLRHDPVRASPPSTAYRVKKFVRRHTVGVTAVSLVVLALAVGAAAATLGLLRAREAERLARLEAETSGQVTQFLLDLFEVSDPSEARGETITAREILDRGAERIENELADQPVVEARLLHTIGKVYASLRLDRPAEALLEKAVELRETTLGPGHPDLARSLNDLGAAKTTLGKFDEAEVLLQRALQMRQSGRDPDNSEAAETLRHLADLFQQQGKWDEAEGIYESLVPLQEELLGLDDPELARTLHGLAWVYHQRADYLAFKEATERSLRIRESALEPDHPEIAASLHRLGDAYKHNDQLDESEDAYDRALTIRKKVFGPEHYETLSTIFNLGGVYSRQKKYDQALALLEWALPIAEEAVGPSDRFVGFFFAAMGDIRLKKGDLAQAATLSERSLSIMENWAGPESPELALFLNNLAEAYLRLGRLAEAESLVHRTLKMETDLGPEHPEVFRSASILANLHRDRGDYDAAEPNYERAVALYDAVRSKEPQIPPGEIFHDFGVLRRRQGRKEDALALFQQALGAREEALGPQADATVESRQACAALLRDLGRGEEAARLESFAGGKAQN